MKTVFALSLSAIELATTLYRPCFAVMRPRFMMWTLRVLLYQQERAAGPNDSTYRKLDQLLDTKDATHED